MAKTDSYQFAKKRDMSTRHCLHNKNAFDSHLYQINFTDLLSAPQITLVKFNVDEIIAERGKIQDGLHPTLLASLGQIA